MQSINTIRLRAMIGWLGMILPWIVVILIWKFPPSISATWYTNACTPFMIILGSASILLMCYQGYEKIDDVINTLTGVAGLGICLFPCSVDELESATKSRYIYDTYEHKQHSTQCMCNRIFRTSCL